MKNVLVFCLLLFVSPVSAQQARFVPVQKDREFRELVPRLSNEATEQLLREDSNVLYYTIAEMPRSFQFAGNNGRARTGFRWFGHNFSGDNDPVFHSSLQPHGRGGNANVDFPWRADVPGGTHRCRNVTSFKAMWLPPREDGNGRKPIVWFYQNLPNPISSAGFDPAYGWVFPRGTRFFEFLVQYGPTGYAYVFEIRERERNIDGWSVEVYRPFPTAASLAERIKAVRPAWESQPHLFRLVSHLENADTLESRVLRDRNRTQTAFAVRAGYDAMPAIGDDDLVAELLMTTQFQPCAGYAWKMAGGLTANAAGFEEDTFHVVPSRYDGAFISVDRDGCMKCHESTNVHARLFDQGRGWYGYVSGSDGILSFSIVDVTAIGVRDNKPVAWRRELLQNGWLERYDPSRHSTEIYKTIPGVK